MTDVIFTVTPPPTTTLVVEADAPTQLVVGQQGPTGPSFTPRSFPVAIAAAGQTVIPMPVPPILLSSVRLTVNGADYAAPDVAVSSTTLLWANPAFALDPSDTVILSYV